MKWRLWITIAAVLSAAACGGSEPVAVIERQTAAGDDLPLDSASCDDVESFALGAHAGDDLHPVIDELGRLAAVFGIGDALPHLEGWRTALNDGDSAASTMDAVADLVDAATIDACGVPAFTAMYVSTSFASCFGRAPIEAGSLAPDTAGCEAGSTATFLPCFTDTGGHVPIDCRTGTIVVLQSGSWVDTGEEPTG